LCWSHRKQECHQSMDRMGNHTRLPDASLQLSPHIFSHGRRGDSSDCHLPSSQCWNLGSKCFSFCKSLSSIIFESKFDGTRRTLPGLFSHHLLVPVSLSFPNHMYLHPCSQHASQAVGIPPSIMLHLGDERLNVPVSNWCLCRFYSVPSLFHCLIFIPGADLIARLGSKSLSETPSPGTAWRPFLVHTILLVIGKAQ
jgi:hypothetical protein